MADEQQEAVKKLLAERVKRAWAEAYDRIIMTEGSVGTEGIGSNVFTSPPKPKKQG